MYYINPNTPNHGNPTSTPFPNSVSLPDTLLMDYINTKGFCTLTVQDGAVTALAVDQEALDAYNETHPDTPPETEPTTDEILNVLLGVSE